MKRLIRQIHPRFRPSWQLMLGGSLVVISAALYALHYLVFRDAHHIVFWSLTSLAFMPISVLFVTLIITVFSPSVSSKPDCASSTWSSERFSARPALGC